MNQAEFPELHDDRVALAAKRIIRQYRLLQTDRGEDIGAIPAMAKPAPDDPHAMRLALDDMTLAIEHIQRLMARREDVFVAALERIERNIAKIAGRIDALADEIVATAARPTIDVDTLIDEQRLMTVGVLREFSAMMELGRSLLDEARQVQIESGAAPGPRAAGPPHGL